MITINELHFAYHRGQFALTIPSIQIESNSAVAVVGPSGSGKTTLLHLMSGFLKPDRGVISVDEVEVSSRSDAERRRFRLQNIGMVFQDFELIEYLNVTDNVLLPCRIGNVIQLSSEIRQRADSLLEMVGLKEHRQKSVTQLSQGERQRVAICRALLTRPKILLADEPTGNLDPDTSEQILTQLLACVRTEGATLVMVTHDHSLLHRFDRTIDFNQFLSMTAARSGESA